MADEVDFHFAARPGRPSGAPHHKIQRLQRTVRTVKRKLDASGAALQDALGERVAARIQHIWYVRVALAKPTMPMRTLSDFCRGFPEQEAKHISHTYVGAARDAMCEAIKRMNRDAVADLVSNLPLGKTQAETAPVFVLHVHDEALMRVRSSTKSSPDSATATPSRARHSKIQNNYIRVHGGLHH